MAVLDGQLRPWIVLPSSPWSCFVNARCEGFTIKDALAQDKWMRHFKADLTAASLLQFLGMWNNLHQFQLTPGQPGSLTWLWTASGTYSASSAYALHFSLSQVVSSHLLPRWPGILMLHPNVSCPLGHCKAGAYLRITLPSVAGTMTPAA